MKIVIVFPTRTEAKRFTHPQVIVEICGVGLTAAAYNTQKIIARHQPDWLIMAGIAGVYSHSPYKLGDVVLISSESEADLGFFTPSGFSHLADLKLEMEFSVQKEWGCPYVSSNFGFPLAKSNSMNAAMAPFVEIIGVDVENMEGAAFFQVCLNEKQPFLQMRSISNMVKIGDDNWDFTGAILALTKGLNSLVAQLLTEKSEVR